MPANAQTRKDVYAIHPWEVEGMEIIQRNSCFWRVDDYTGQCVGFVRLIVTPAGRAFYRVHVAGGFRYMSSLFGAAHELIFHSRARQKSREK